MYVKWFEWVEILSKIRCFNANSPRSLQYALIEKKSGLDFSHAFLGILDTRCFFPGFSLLFLAFSSKSQKQGKLACVTRTINECKHGWTTNRDSPLNKQKCTKPRAHKAAATRAIFCLRWWCDSWKNRPKKSREIEWVEFFATKSWTLSLALQHFALHSWQFVTRPGVIEPIRCESRKNWRQA